MLTELQRRDLIETRSGETDRRQKLLRLTPAGATLEAELFDALRSRLSQAYRRAGQDSVTGFWRVLEGLVPDADRVLLAELGNDRRPG